MRDRLAHPRRRLAALVLAAAWLAAFPAGAVGTDPDGLCDPGLELESDDPTAYRLRDDRCEGVYRLKVNSDKLRVRSWTAWFEHYDFTDAAPLEVSWRLPPESSGPVRLRAHALRPDTYYRMDTRLAGSETPWSWPSGFLGQLRLGRADLGLLGWTTMELADGQEEPLYLPLTVRQKAAARPEGYTVVLVPGERLREVRWSVSKVLDGERVGPPLGGDHPLGYGYYPARRPTSFTVPAPEEPGLYVLDVAVDLRTESLPASRRLWFYHPGAGGPPATAAAADDPGVTP